MGHRTPLLAIAVGLLVTTALGGGWAGAGWGWDAANALGFAAAALIVFLHVETGAARNRPVALAAFHSKLHANVAALALGFAVVHVAGLTADDRMTLEYWALSAPPYMLAGFVALLVMIAVVASAYPRPRRAVFDSPQRFRRLHGIASLALTALVAWHIAGSALYLDTRVKQTLFAAALVGVPAWLSWRPAFERPLLDAPRRDATEARRETVWIGAALVAIAALFTLLRNLR
ncbi:MAG TPA: ferric reductase-like transmembrane domain-containing protein [Pseudomonadales bacterium]|nr:ferric reductase-like transmembrane domain-containing protein [Pseudomonadales bacterium]